MNTLLQDLKFSFRLLARSPGFTAAATLVLALGIGVNTSIFSLVHAMVFSPRPWPAEKQVVQVYTQDEKIPKKFRLFSYPTFKEIQQHSTAFNGLMAHTVTVVGVGEGESTRRVFSSIVSSNFFSTLQVPLIRGRSFLPAEETPGAADQVMIASYNYWQRLGFPADFIGSTLRINERPFTVVGITPQGFSGTMMLLGPELYFPLGCFDLLNNDSVAGGLRPLTLDVEQRVRADVVCLALIAPEAMALGRPADYAIEHQVARRTKHIFAAGCACSLKRQCRSAEVVDPGQLLVEYFNITVQHDRRTAFDIGRIDVQRTCNRAESGVQ